MDWSVKKVARSLSVGRERSQSPLIPTATIVYNCPIVIFAG